MNISIKWHLKFDSPELILCRLSTLFEIIKFKEDGFDR